MGITAIVLLILYLFFEFTLLGKAVRACAISRQTAELIGINTETVSMFAYSVSAGMSAIAGIVIAPLTLVSYDMGLVLGLKGFIVAIIGGMVNAPAAVIGGLALGVLESFTSGLLSSGIKDAIAYSVLFAVLLVRTFKGTGLRKKRS